MLCFIWVLLCQFLLLMVALVNENPMNVIQVKSIVTRSGRTLQEIMRTNNVDAQRVVANNEPPKEKIETQTKEVEGIYELKVNDFDVAAPTMLPTVK
ncbi:hypothetical protein R3W88_022763 [Solanum pinnatisectum]|uniref:Uncharacterized protein n=1 Tax=Solanum pinnatisectum TaxID=50273 RepID=A0AAV9LVI7_9SOLN|nr:hypothetical protein R3W88_022763 [Solanum pinnatisectum]